MKTFVPFVFNLEIIQIDISIIKEKLIIDCFVLIKKYTSLKNNRELLFQLDVSGEILPL